MEWLSVAEEAAIRRMAYIAVLRGDLTAFASRERFARQIGRSREYIEQLIRIEGVRVPGRAVAETIANGLHLTQRRRDDLLEQMLLASPKRLRARRAEPADRSVPFHPIEIERIRRAHADAMYSVDSRFAGAQYRWLAAVIPQQLDRGEASRQPLLTIELLLVLHDIEIQRNRPASALVHAFAAAAILRRLDAGDSRLERERLDDLRIRAPLAEAVSMAQLGLAKLADASLARGESAIAASRTETAHWRPHLLRSRLAALRQRNRFSLYVAEGLAISAKAGWSRGSDPLAPQCDLLADVELAQAYLRYGTPASRRKAHRVLRGSMDRLDQIPHLGPVRRAAILRTFADACLGVRDLDQWDDYSRRALRVASDAGLEREFALLEERRIRISRCDPVPHGEDA